MRRIVVDTNCLLMCVSPMSKYHEVWSEYFNLIEADPDDNKFVDCAVCGNAEYIVSNDSHFRVLNDIDWPRLQLVTIQEYVKEIDNL